VDYIHMTATEDQPSSSYAAGTSNFMFWLQRYHKQHKAK